MMSMPLSDCVVIFDLDGTLVDSALDLSVTLNYVLAQEGLPPLSLAEMRLMVGQGAVAMMTQGFTAAGSAFPDGAEKDRLLELFIEHYRENIAVRTIPFEGCLELLSTLKMAGATLAVCTNKREELARRLMGALDLTDRFEVILGRDTLPEYKPSAMPLLEIIRRTGKQDAVMVGDTYTDRDAARAAQIPCALATFGYGTLDEPLRSTEQTFDHYEQLFDIILKLNEQSKLAM